MVSYLAVGEDGGVWPYRTGMTLDRPELVRVDPSTNRVAATIALPPGPPGIPSGASALLVAGGSVWLADLHNAMPAVWLAAGAGQLWLYDLSWQVAASKGERLPAAAARRGQPSRAARRAGRHIGPMKG